MCIFQFIYWWCVYSLEFSFTGDRFSTIRTVIATKIPIVSFETNVCSRISLWINREIMCTSEWIFLVADVVCVELVDLWNHHLFVSYLRVVSSMSSTNIIKWTATKIILFFIRHVFLCVSTVLWESFTFVPRDELFILLQNIFKIHRLFHWRSCFSLTDNQFHRITISMQLFTWKCASWHHNLIKTHFNFRKKKKKWKFFRCNHRFGAESPLHCLPWHRTHRKKLSMNGHFNRRF